MTGVIERNACRIAIGTTESNCESSPSRVHFQGGVWSAPRKQVHNPPPDGHRCLELPEVIQNRVDMDVSVPQLTDFSPIPVSLGLFFVYHLGRYRQRKKSRCPLGL